LHDDERDEIERESGEESANEKGGNSSGFSMSSLSLRFRPGSQYLPPLQEASQLVMRSFSLSLPFSLSLYLSIYLSISVSLSLASSLSISSSLCSTSVTRLNFILLLEPLAGGVIRAGVNEEDDEIMSIKQRFQQFLFK
jgi:hypothetical protein